MEKLLSDAPLKKQTGKESDMEFLQIGKDSSGWGIETWRLALERHCEASKQDEKDKWYGLLRKITAYLIQKNTYTFNPESYTDRVSEIATKVFASITKTGFYRVPPHGEMFFDGTKTAMVDFRLFEKLSTQFLYLCSGKLCYGMARFKEPMKINLKEFTNLGSKHRISEDERLAWWPNRSQLYYYELRDFFRFDKPKKIKASKGVQAFIKNASVRASDKLTWPEEMPIEYIIASEPVQGEGNLGLILRHAQVHAKAEENLSGGVLKEHAIIVNEMKRNGLQHRSTTILDSFYDEVKAHSYRIKFLGTKGEIEERNKAHEKHTGVLIQAGNKRLLVDCGDPEHLKTSPDLVLLTHYHEGHTDGLRGRADKIDFPIYASPNSRCEISDRLEKNGLKINWQTKGEWDLFKFAAFPVVHSRVAPAVAWKIWLGKEVILIAPDVLRLIDPEKVLRDVTIYIGDGATYRRDIKRKSKADAGSWIGHASITTQMKWIEEYGKQVRKFFAINVGSMFVKNPKLETAAEKEYELLHVASDGEVYKSEFSLVSLEEVLPLFPKRFSTGLKYCWAGSLPMNGFGRDIDIIERGSPDLDAKVRMGQFLEEFQDRLSFHRGDTGPHNNYIPLYHRVYELAESFPQITTMPFMASDDWKFSDLALEQGAKRQAIQSRREDKVKPFRFFSLQKTRAGYHKREVFTPEEAIDMLDEDLMPYICEEKIDGMNIAAHRVGKKLILFSEDGKEQNLEQCKKLVIFLKSLDTDFVITGELEMWLQKKAAIERGLATSETQATKGGFVHVGRADTTGYMHSKKYDPVLDAGLHLAVYDIVWADGEDIHKEPILDRAEIRFKIFPAESERFAKPAFALVHKSIKDGKDLVSLWNRMKAMPYVEGIMLKATRESKYVLWYDGGNHIKVKSLYELLTKTFEKKEAVSKAGKRLGVYSYLCGIRREGKYVPIGWTYNTKVDIAKGGLLEVRFQQLNKYITSGGKVWYNWYRCSVVGPKPEAKQADTAEIAERLVRATKGQTKKKEVPSDIMKYFGELSASDLEGFWDDLAIELSAFDFGTVAKEPPMPKEWQKRIASAKRLRPDKVGAEKLPKHFYIMQHHIRGRTAHIDFRFRVNEHLEGLTLMNMVKGSIEEPILSWKDMDAYLKEYRTNPASVSKFYPDMKPHQGVLIAEKSTQPLDWATIVREMREAGETPIASKNFPGFMQAFDQGLCVVTVKKPWFLELWLYGRDIDARRIVVRLLPRAKKDAEHSLQEAGGKLPTYSRLHIANTQSPPYLLTRRAFEAKWVPSEGSGLPPNWEAAVPKELHWWGRNLPRAKKLELIAAAYNYFIEEDFLKAQKISLDKEDFPSDTLRENVKKTTTPFVLHRVWWRGPKVVRHIPVSTWHLRIKHRGQLLDWVFNEDPTQEGQFAAIRKVVKYEPPGGESPVDWLKFTGKLPPGHPENPNKKLEANVTRIDAGSLSVVTDTPDFFSFATKKSKLLKGYYYFRLGSTDSKFWLFERTGKVGAEG